LPSLTVVIPVHNSQGTLGRVLAPVISELHPDDRVLAVDDRSFDGSVKLLESLGVEAIPSLGKPGAAGTRNTGGMAAETSWILFLDSDAVPPEGWRSMLEAGMREADAVQAVYGPDAPGSRAATFYKNYYYHHTFTRRIRGPYIKGCGTFFFAVKTSAFRELGGFDENIRGATIEDADFAERLWARGGRILIAPLIEVYHLREYTLGEFLSYEWNMMMAKALYIIRRGRGRGAPSISVAGFSEMVPVLFGAVFSWLIPVGAILAAVGASWGLPLFLGGILLALGPQAPMLVHMVRAGGFRGFRAGFLLIPDLLMVLPASLSAAGAALSGRRY
jgi:GT2 family glycosyltransferase